MSITLNFPLGIPITIICVHYIKHFNDYATALITRRFCIDYTSLLYRVNLSTLFSTPRYCIEYTSPQYRVYLASAKGLCGSMRQVVGLPNNSYKPIINMAWVHTRLCKLQKRCTRLASASDKVYQLLGHGPLWVLRLLPPLKLVAMIQLKYC